ncbi:uncharacterized protein RMCN_5959 [Mycolicibacterium novocastrense]|uniref:Uncharacterized protein n=2 Tax=Mycolicibacterium novocastrense TaxID=59813 RepID=A0ABQ0KT85_MYCNV|nr:uncharacterized protein RMCN_5959 [Mycolicibacterium novocastrense]
MTTRLRPAVSATALLPKATSAFDGKTVRLRPIDLPVVGKVANTVRQRYLDLSTVKKPPTKWDVARLFLVLLLASMPILGISVDVFGLVPQNVTSVVVIALGAVLGALIAFAPHRIDMIVGRGLIAGMVACIVYDAARLFAVHVLGLMGDFIPVMGSFVTGEPDTAGSAAVGYVWRYIGDGGGLGVAFFVVAFALGIDRWRKRPRGAGIGRLRGVPDVGGSDGDGCAGSARRGDDVPAERRDGDDHSGRTPDLRAGAGAGLPEGATRAGPQRMALAPLFESAPAKRVIRAYKRFTHRP